MSKAIVPATHELVAVIESWLDAEEAAYQQAHAMWMEGRNDCEFPQRGFRCNWDMARDAWACGESKLDVLLLDGEAVGFLSDTDILEIHPEHRGKGLGVLMSDFMLKRVFDEGYSVLEIEIAPTTAEPFWRRQGFELLDNKIHFHHGMHAYQIIARSFELGNGPRVPVEVAFYDEDSRYAERPPFVEFVGFGERLADGSIQLPERVHGYTPFQRYNTENHIRIAVDGEELYFGRSKYQQQYGQSKDPGGNHYIDRIVP